MRLDTVFKDKQHKTPLAISGATKAKVQGIAASIVANNPPLSLKGTSGFADNYTPTAGRKPVAPKQVYDYMTKQYGLNNIAALGILANVKRESDFNTEAVGDNGNAFGLFQHNGSRMRALKAYADANDKDVTDYRTQIDFLMSEPDMNKGMIQKLNSAATPEKAGALFTRKVERPADIEGGIEKQNQYLAGKYGDNYSPIFAKGGKLPPKFFNGGAFTNWLATTNLNDSKSVANGGTGKASAASVAQAGNIAAVGAGVLSSGIDSLNNQDNPDVGLSTASGILSGAATGASVGATFGNPYTIAAGAIIGGVAGGINGNKNAKSTREQFATNLANKNRRNTAFLETQANAMLAAFPTNATQYSYFAKGGTIPKRKEANGNKLFATTTALGKKSPKYHTADYEVEKKEVVQGADAILEDSKQIASDLQLVKGKSHADGGTMGTGGERVFSYQLKADSQLTDFMKQRGVNVKPKSSFAEIAHKLGKIKGKAEENAVSNNHRRKLTGNVMLQKVSPLIDLTFQAQESIKAPTVPALTFAYGGTIPKKTKKKQPLKKYNGGGYLVKEGQTVFEIAEEVGVPVDELIKLNGISDVTAPLYRGQELVLPESGQFNAKYPGVQNYARGKFNYDKLRASSVGNPAASTPFGQTNTVDQRANTGQVSTNNAIAKGNPTTPKVNPRSIDAVNTFRFTAPLAAFAASNQNINNLETEIDTALAKNPTFTYRDNNQLAKSDLKTGYTTLAKGLSSAQKGNLYGNYIKGVNQINNSEADRRVNAQNQFANVNASVNLRNAAAQNSINATNVNLKNNQTNLRRANTSGLLGNYSQAFKDMAAGKLDEKKFAYILEALNAQAPGAGNRTAINLRKKG